MRKLLALGSIGFAMFIWYLAISAGDRANQDWAPLATVLYGVVGGLPLFIASLLSSLHHQKDRENNLRRGASGRETLAPVLLFLNAGWVLTVLAVLKVAIAS